MTWYPTLNDLKIFYSILKKKYSNLEDEHNLVGHHIIGDKEQALKGDLDSLRYGLPMEKLDFWLKTVRFLRDLTNTHGFTEGNHRLAYSSTSHFLKMNGYLLELPEDEAEKFTRLVGDKLAESNSILNFKPIAKWLKSKCEKTK